jgi:predicted ester cyclase
MSVEENKAIVRRYFEEALNRQNLAIINELLAADFINHSPRIATVGREETAQDLARFFTAFPDWQTILEDIIAEGDRVVVRRTVHGTHRGLFLASP